MRSEASRSCLDVDAAGGGRGTGRRRNVESRCSAKTRALGGGGRGRSLRTGVWCTGPREPRLLAILRRRRRGFVKFVTVVRKIGGSCLRQLCGSLSGTRGGSDWSGQGEGITTVLAVTKSLAGKWVQNRADKEPRGLIARSRTSVSCVLEGSSVKLESRGMRRM